MNTNCTLVLKKAKHSCMILALAFFVSTFAVKAANPPQLISPTDGDATLLLQPSFTWSKVTGATKYTFQIANDQNFTQIAHTCDTITPTGKEIVYSITIRLNWATRYYWRVKATVPPSETAWSTVWSFTTKLEDPRHIYPPNSGSNIPISGEFKWASATGALTYTLQVKEVDRTGFVINQSGITDTFFIYSGLKYNTQYSWQMRAENGSMVSYWTNSWDFRTVLPTPILILPQHFIYAVPLQGNLKWFSVEGATSYKVQIATTSDFLPCVLDATVTDTTKSYSNLENMKRYYWRVRAENSYGYSDWSEVRFFFTKIAKPIPLSHLNDSKQIPINDTLKWNPVDSADSYNIQLSKNEDFSDIFIEQTNLKNTYFLHSNLENKTKYYWRVSATNINETTDWSDIWNFTTQLEAPILSAPANLQKGLPFNDTLSWNIVKGAIKYRLQLSTSPIFSTLIVNQDIADIYYEYIDLTSYTKYYWRVNADDGEEVSPWSEVRSFTTKLIQPELLSPDNNIYKISVNGKLIWRAIAGADSYSLQLSDKSDFSTKVTDASNIKDTSYPYSNLKNNTKYYWRINAKNSDVTSDWSEISNFTTLLASPVLKNPGNESNNILVNGSLIWNKVPGAASYHIKVSKNDDMSECEIDVSEFPDSVYTYSNLSPLTRYYWQVMGENPDNYGDYSDIWTFTTNSGESVDDPLINFDNVTIFINPNPAMDKLKMCVNVVVPSQVSLNIFDIYGRKISNIFNDYLYSGVYSYNFKVEELPEGMYFVYVIANGKANVTKFLVVK